MGTRRLVKAVLLTGSVLVCSTTIPVYYRKNNSTPAKSEINVNSNWVTGYRGLRIQDDIPYRDTLEENVQCLAKNIEQLLTHEEIENLLRCTRGFTWLEPLLGTYFSLYLEQLAQNFSNSNISDSPLSVLKKKFFGQQVYTDEKREQYAEAIARQFVETCQDAGYLDLSILDDPVEKRRHLLELFTDDRFQCYGHNFFVDRDVQDETRSGGIVHQLRRWINDDFSSEAYELLNEHGYVVLRKVVSEEDIDDIRSSLAVIPNPIELALDKIHPEKLATTEIESNMINKKSSRTTFMVPGVVEIYRKFADEEQINRVIEKKKYKPGDEYPPFLYRADKRVTVKELMQGWLGWNIRGQDRFLYPVAIIQEKWLPVVYKYMASILIEQSLQETTQQNNNRIYNSDAMCVLSLANSADFSWHRFSTQPGVHTILSLIPETQDSRKQSCSITVIPGSHKDLLHSLRQYPDIVKPVEIVLDSSDVLIYDRRILQRRRGNTSLKEGGAFVLLGYGFHRQDSQNRYFRERCFERLTGKLTGWLCNLQNS